VRYIYIIHTLKLFFFQIRADMERYLNEKQFSMVQRKITSRNSEIKMHVEYFQHIIVES